MINEGALLAEAKARSLRSLAEALRRLPVGYQLVWRDGRLLEVESGPSPEDLPVLAPSRLTEITRLRMVPESASLGHLPDALTGLELWLGAGPSPAAVFAWAKGWEARAVRARMVSEEELG
jgi:hypothetical protein